MVDSNDVHVPLVVLSLPATLRRFEPPALWNRIPLERKRHSDFSRLQIGLIENHPRQGGRHFRSQRNVLPLLVDEIVHLIDNFLAGLAFVEANMLQDGSVVFLKAKRLRGGSEVVEQPVLDPHFRRVKIASPARAVQVFGTIRGGGDVFGGLFHQSVEFLSDLLFRPRRVTQFGDEALFHFRAFVLAFVGGDLLFGCGFAF
mmetsp:Transcript_69446/g.104782  ORF Transcript_69446/g.104782 Transcript_69446/m.104782 type:complete len:201 (-) Transcript_69446:184-786(-)